MTETEAITRLEAELNSIKGLTIHVLDRNFENRTKYIATFGAIAKNESFTQDTLKSLIDSLIDDGIDEIKVVGTQKK